MKQRLISALAVALGIVSVQAASAADVDMYVKAPIPYFTWTGFYAGATAGFVLGDTSTQDTLATNNLPWVQNGASWGTKANGFAGGADLGYNWQVGNLVLGVEGDAGYLGVKGTSSYPLLPTTTATTDGGGFASARARLGVAIDHVMVYGTGGWFGAEAGAHVDQSTGGTIIHTASTGFQSGWAAGGGIEWAFAPRWSLKGEYLHYDLGTEKVGGSIFGGSVTQFFNIKNTGEIVRAGVNYHF